MPNLTVDDESVNYIDTLRSELKKPKGSLPNRKVVTIWTIEYVKANHDHFLDYARKKAAKT